VTYEEAVSLKRVFDRMKTVVERTEILFEADGSCGLLIVRLDDIRETFMDALEAEWALTYTTRDEVFGGSLYAILGHDNIRKTIYQVAEKLT
jgi:hypothetical protein